MDSTTTTTSHHHRHRGRHENPSFLSKRRRTIRHRSTTTTTSTSSSDEYTSSSTTTTTTTTITTPPPFLSEEEDLAHCLILLAHGIHGPGPTRPMTNYECKTCNRAFPTFQALGGHRASHRKPKPNPTPTTTNIQPTPSDDENDRRVPMDDQDEAVNNNNNDVVLINKFKVRVHECSICGSEFPSGQALGGHMRRHRPPTLPAPPHPDRPIMINVGDQKNVLPLDLNLPAMPDDDDDDDMESKFHVLSTPALVDCHY